MGKNKNKIKYGLKNVHWATVTETVDETTGKTTTTYGTPVKWPGAVSMSLDPSGESSTFYADDTAYAVLSSNTGYEGDFESALVPDEVLSNVYGQDEIDGVLVESDSNETKYIALMFEVNGDAKARRFVLYRCMLTRPALSSATKEDSTEPATDSVTITATPRPDVDIINNEEKHLTKAVTQETTSADVYNNWFKEVWVPTQAEG